MGARRNLRRRRETDAFIAKPREPPREWAAKHGRGTRIELVARANEAARTTEACVRRPARLRRVRSKL